MKKVLIVEDDPSVRESLGGFLGRAGYDVTALVDAEEAIRQCELGLQHEVALIDMRLPGISGIDLLRFFRERSPEMDCIIVTGFGTIETAVEAMKCGARDYLTKPLHDGALKILLERLFEMRRLKDENELLKKPVAPGRNGFYGLIGSSADMCQIYRIIEAVGNSSATVLVKGESGTGKGMIAQTVHGHDPKRKDKPFVEVSCGAIPKELLESELFGHVKGAFTGAIRDRIGRFEMASGGTIFLDEIDTLPLYLQVKLLRVLQHKTFEMVGDNKTKRVDLRIIAATNRNLEDEIRKGLFREDLYYRLNVVTIEISPLRMRRDDIPMLTRHFLRQFNEKNERKIRGITKEAMKALVEYPWPGNVRELENMLERVAILVQGDVIEIGDFPAYITRKERARVPAYGPKGAYALRETLQGSEKEIILQALEHAGGNRKKAAGILDINRTTLYNKMRRHQIY